jgi:hypothetical protein
MDRSLRWSAVHRGVVKSDLYARVLVQGVSIHYRYSPFNVRKAFSSELRKRWWNRLLRVKSTQVNTERGKKESVVDPSVDEGGFEQLVDDQNRVIIRIVVKCNGR